MYMKGPNFIYINSADDSAEQKPVNTDTLQRKYNVRKVFTRIALSAAVIIPTGLLIHEKGVNEKLKSEQRISDNAHDEESLLLKEFYTANAVRQAQENEAAQTVAVELAEFGIKGINYVPVTNGVADVDITSGECNVRFDVNGSVRTGDLTFIPRSKRGELANHPGIDIDKPEDSERLVAEYCDF